MSLVYVLLNTEPSKMEHVFKKIQEIDGVEEAYMVYGNYDICVKVKSKVPKELRNIIQKIRIEDNVQSPLTLMIIKE